MSVQPNAYPLRVNKELFDKFKVIAKNNGRSVNKEIEVMIKKSVQDYEQQNGTIEVPTLHPLIK